MADKKKMSVADILAAARRADGGGAAATPASSPPSTAESPSPVDESAAEVAEAAAEAPSEPAPKPAAPKSAAGGGRPNIKDILAAARAGGAAGAAPPAAPAPKKEPQPAAAKAAPAKKEPAEKKAAPVAKAAGAKDTASILAAARNPNKAGPVSKAEAAEKGVPVTAKEKPAKAPLAAPPMPTKPAALAKSPASKGAPATDADRRGILGLILGSFLGAGFTSLAATSGLWGLGAARFAFPNVLTEPPSRFKVGFPNDFPPGQVADKFKAQFGVWVVNTEWQGVQQIFALRTVCTHLGCTPNWLEGEQKYKCPCHGSGFYKDGINFEGPAPRPLERYAIRLADDGQLEIDKSRIFQEEMGQWKDPNCFVLV